MFHFSPRSKKSLKKQHFTKIDEILFKNTLFWDIVLILKCNLKFKVPKPYNKSVMLGEWVKFWPKLHDDIF